MNRHSNGGDQRRHEHDADALLLLDRFMRIPQNAPTNGWPSTAELQAERIYGLRPVNRIGDLKKGKYNGHCYDFEMIPCGHGVNRWRLHWPNRPGYPKVKGQTILPLDPKSPKKSWDEVCAERDQKLAEPEPEWSLTP